MLNFQTLFEAIPGLYLVLTPDFRIVAASDAYLQATMRTRENLLDHVMFDAYPDNPDDPNANGVENLRASLESVLQHRKPHTMAVQKYDIIRPESSGGGFEERYWSPVNSPLFGANGEITHIIHRVEDVTEFVRTKQQRIEERRINQALQIRTQQMEMEIYLRAQELQQLNKQLQSANAALAELDRAKTEFFSNVSHEFRTPLTLMLSPVEDALMDALSPLPPVQRDRLQVVQRNGLGLLKLVNTLLDFSRIQAGRIQAVYEPTDLATFTAELASVFRSTIEKAGIGLIVECPPLPEAIYVDREFWEKIVFNLLSNAFKFTFAGSITVRLQWAETHVELTVTDTGIGIPAAELPHLFERFHRVKVARGRSFEGSGIGLSLVQELVKLHQGTINVTSVVGQGSSFTVSIPTGTTHLPTQSIGTRRLTSTALNAIAYLEEAQRWLPQEEGRETGGDEEASTLSPLSGVSSRSRILLADDNADMRDYVKGLLSTRYRVETVADGIAALNAVRENPPDLLLADVMMPGIDGFELLRELRADPQTQQIPIILLSARAGEESRIEGLEAGADDYLIKPFSARELLARVEANLKLAQLRQTAQVREQTLLFEAKTAEANLQGVLSSIRDGFYVLDRDGCITYINSRQLEIIGMQREDVLGKNIWELFPDLVGDEFYNRVAQAVREQTSVQFEYYYAPWNRWFENRIYPTPDGIAIICAEITQRKLTEIALQQSEQRYRDLAQAMPQIVWTADVTGAMNYFNQQWYDYTGLSEADSMGFESIEVVNPSERDRTLQAWVNAIAGEKPAEIEYRLRRFDGVYRWFISRGLPLRDSTGQITSWVGTITDIDDQKRTESGLRESERRFRRLVESNLFGVVFGDCFDGLHYANDYLLNLVGYTLEEMQSGEVRWEQLTPNEFAPLDAKAVEQLSTQGVCAPYEKVYLHKNGRRIPILIAAALLEEPYNQAQEVIAFILDLTERKQAESALQKSELNFRTLADSMPQLFWTTQPDGYHDYFNGRWYEYTGMTLEQTQGWGWSHLLHPDDQQRCLEIWNESLSTGKVYNIEYRFKQASDGQYRWFLGRAIPLRENGQIVKWFGSCTDIHEQKCAQQERDRASEQAQIAREQAETANRIKDEFLAVLSHELRTPLNPILGWAKLLRSKNFDKKTSERALETIERNAKLQSQLIEDLLDISRILRGKMSLNITSVDLGTVIAAATETVRLAAEAKSLQIQTAISPLFGTVNGDAARLQQVVWNLLSNAVKFTEGGIIQVSLTQVGTYAQIQVKDTGKGIHPDFLPYVFEHFRQEDGATTRKFGGLGLGLAIVRQIVEMHGGTVQADSAGVGQGASFTVKIPTTAPSGEMVSVEESSSKVDLNGIKILVVDDEADSREFIAFVLEQENAIVTTAASGFDALQIIEQSIPDIIVSDIGMPEMDGYMLMQQIRQGKPGESIGAIALTAYAGELDRKLALAAGFGRHLAKPVEIDQLLNALATLAYRKHSENQNSTSTEILS